MKIMHFIHGLNTGGAETLVKEYVTRLDKEKFEIVVLCYEHHKDSPYEKIIQESGIKVIYVCDYFKTFLKGTIIERLFNKIQRYLLIKKFIHMENLDIIHTHLIINKYVKFARPKKRVKIIHTIHGEIDRYNDLDPKDIKALKWLIKHYKTKIICLHDKMRIDANKILNINDSIVLNNGIDFKKFEQAKSKKEVRKALGLSNDLYIIGHVGRFDKVKNHEFLVKVFMEICHAKSNAFLLMIGSGAERNNIEKALHDYGLDNNYLILSNRTDIPDLLNSMDIFVFPSKSEGLGISLIEAQKSKLPCVVSTAIPNNAIISNLVKKISLDVDEKQWASEILSFKKPSNIILNDSNWSIDEVIKQLESIYLEQL